MNTHYLCLVLTRLPQVFIDQTRNLGWFATPCLTSHQDKLTLNYRVHNLILFPENGKVSHRVRYSLIGRQSWAFFIDMPFELFGFPQNRINLNDFLNLKGNRLCFHNWAIFLFLFDWSHKLPWSSFFLSIFYLFPHLLCFFPFQLLSLFELPCIDLLKHLILVNFIRRRRWWFHQFYSNIIFFKLA